MYLDKRSCDWWKYFDRLILNKIKNQSNSAVNCIQLWTRILTNNSHVKISPHLTSFFTPFPTLSLVTNTKEVLRHKNIQIYTALHCVIIQGKGNVILTNDSKGKFPHNPLPIFLPFFLFTPFQLHAKTRYTTTLPKVSWFFF